MQNMSTKPENIFATCAHRYFRVFFFVNKLLLLFLLFLNFIVVFIARSIGGCNGVPRAPISVQFHSFSCSFPETFGLNDRLIPLPLGFTHPVWDTLALPLAPVSCEIRSSLTQLYLATRMTTDRVRLLLMPHYSNIAIFKGIFIDFVQIINSKDNHQPH